MMLNVDVVYALPDSATLLHCQVNSPCTIEQAIRQSGIISQCQLDLTQLKVGVFGKLVTLQTQVNAGDRIELYRPLLADPKEIRRRRAREKQAHAKM